MSDDAAAGPSQPSARPGAGTISRPRFTAARAFIRSLLADLRPQRFAQAYAVAFLLVNVVLLASPEAVQAKAQLAASTNIAHLAVDPLFVLFSSALIDQGQLWLWIPLILLLVGGLEKAMGTRRTVLATFGAHAAASLLSEGILLVQILEGREPTSALHTVDVGPSYMILAALAGCLIAGGLRLRLAALAVGALIVPQLLHGLTGLEMDAVGHVASLVLGAAFIVWLTRRFTVRVDRLQLVWTRLVWARPPLTTVNGSSLTLPGAQLRLPLRPVAALVRLLAGRLRPRRSPAPASAGAGRCR